MMDLSDIKEEMKRRMVYFSVKKKEDGEDRSALSYLEACYGCVIDELEELERLGEF